MTNLEHSTNNEPSDSRQEGISAFASIGREKIFNKIYAIGTLFLGIATKCNSDHQIYSYGYDVLLPFSFYFGLKELNILNLGSNRLKTVSTVLAGCLLYEGLQQFQIINGVAEIGDVVAYIGGLSAASLADKITMNVLSRKR